MKKIVIYFLPLLIVISCAAPDATFEAVVGDQSASPVEVTFTNSSENADAYTWYFGDGQMSNEVSPVHRYTRFGEIPVVLEAKKGNKTDRDTQYINIVEPPRKKVRIETPLGVMIAELYNTTPIHRDNFLKLASEGYYDGLLFHRVINQFMVQGGDPESRNAPSDQPLGMGGPGYTLPAEIGEYHFKGSLAAARMPDQVNPNKESSGSQFYIVHGRKFSGMELNNMGSQIGITFNQQQKDGYSDIGGYPPLDGGYTVFGRVIEGFEVIDAIAAVETQPNDRPLEDIAMKVTVIEE